MIARKSALIIFIQFLNGILGYIGLKYISLYMQPWEYGIVGFAYGFVALFSIIGTLGFRHAHIKKISEGKNLGKCIGTFAVTKLSLAGFLAIFTFFAVAIWRYVFGRGFESPAHEQAIYVMLAYFVLLTLTQIMITTFKARKEIAKSQIPLLSYNIARFIAIIYVAINDLGALALVYTYLFGEIFHFIIAFYYFKNYSIDKPSYDCFKDYTKFAVPMAIATSCFIIITNIDKVFIQLFWSSQQVGEYFAVFNLSRFIILFASSVGMLLFPTISEYHVKKEIKKIKDIVLKSERYLSMIVFPIIVTMIVLAQPIIHILLSDKYLPAISVLQILPIFVLIEVLSRPYDNQLVGMNMPNISRNRVFIMVFINVFLNLILIPRDINSIGLKMAGLGATGAAIATVVSYLVGLIYIRILAWKKTGIIGEKRVLIHAFAAMISGSFLFYINILYIIDRWYHLLIISIFGLGIYIGILYLVKELKRDDLIFFLDTLNIKKMFEYIRDEIKK